MALGGGAYMNLINSANIVLIPKRPDVEAVADYRPISLIHNISKIFSKLMANCLAPVLGNLISKNQSTFIKTRCIHDNFLYVQNLIKELHRAKTPSLFIKLDISKAFDSVSWAYLLEVLHHLGFGPRWLSWVCITLSSATSRVLLNGNPGIAFNHRRGLRHGDPLSPMLFDTAIDPLQKLIEFATREGVLLPIRAKTASFRASLYADDAGVFANPDKDELQSLLAILDFFGKASGLITNLTKTEVFPIRCGNIDIPDLLSDFPAKIGAFPGNYLGLPLYYKRLRKVHLQPLIDKIGQKLPRWFGKNIAHPGKVTLAKIVLAATATYHQTIIPIPLGALRKVDKIARGFIWKGDDSEMASGGHSLINWDMVCRPLQLGGLGMPNLECFGRALFASDGHGFNGPTQIGLG
jgi:hypothetical protein